MEDLKLDEDDLSSHSLSAAHGPSPFGVGPLPRTLFFRETGIDPRRASGGKRIVVTTVVARNGGNAAGGQQNVDDDEDNQPVKSVVSFSTSGTADEVAEEHLIDRTSFMVTPCKLKDPSTGSGGGNAPADPLGLGIAPGFHNGFGMGGSGGANGTRSTFLMVFSPDKKLIASTHGDHNVYVSRVEDGECVSVLTGHPRTPWCVAFHPSLDGVLASGCLGGQVRLWDINGGGSEVWRAEVVIASLAFHPTDRLLVIATFNELHFWDWSEPMPFAVVRTKNEKEKVRYVKFDAVGHTLITGIANLSHQQQPYGCLPPSGASHIRTSSMHFSGGGVGGNGGGSSPSVLAYEERRNRIRDRYARFLEQYRETAPPHAVRVSTGNAPPPPPLPPLPPPSAMRLSIDQAALADATSAPPPPLPGRSWRYTVGGGRSYVPPPSLLTSGVTPPSSSLPASASSTATSAGLLMDRGTDPMLPSTSTRSTFTSASQTLSDLAQAATNQLMAENSMSNNAGSPSTAAAAAAAAAAATTPSSAHPQSSRESSVERDDLQSYLLSDSSTLRRRRNRMMLWNDSFWERGATAGGRSSGGSGVGVREPPSPLDTMRDHSYVRRELRERMMELSRSSRSAISSSASSTPPAFSHSPESEFVEVGNGHPASRTSFSGGGTTPTAFAGAGNSTEVFLNPDRAPAREANLRFRNTRDHRLRELLDRREYLMTQIERLSSAGELLYPVDGSGRAAASQSAAATSSGGGGRGGASSRRPPSLADHNYGVASRPIDEWAVNRRINLELAAERASHFREAADADAAAAAAIAAEDPTVNVLNEADVATATEPVVDSARLLGGGERLPTYDEAIRRQQQQQQDHHVPEELRLPTYETSTRSTARMSRRALQLRHSYHHRIPPRLTLPRQHSRVAAAVTSTATAASTAASGRPLLRLERNSSHEEDNPATRSQGTSMPATTATASTSTSAAATSLSSGSGSDQHNLDTVLLSILRICRESLTDLGGVARQHRQVTRLQSIRRMLEDLQRQIRNMRGATSQEITRRRSESAVAELQQQTARTEAQSVMLTGSEQTAAARRGAAAVAAAAASGAACTRTPTSLTSSTARLVQRSTAALARLASGAGGQRHALSPSLARRTAAAAGSARGSGGGRLHRSVRVDATTTRRARLSRAHSQLVSQLRATFRAMEMSPDLARQSHNPISRSRAEESRNVMERTEQEAAVVVTANATSSNARNELRALSQRLEGVLRQQREEGADEVLGTAADEAGGGVNDDADLPDFADLNGSSFLDDPFPELRYRRAARSSQGALYDHTLPSDAPASTSRRRSLLSHYFASSSESEEDSESDQNASTGGVGAYAYTYAAAAGGRVSRRLARMQFQQQGGRNLPNFSDDSDSKRFRDILDFPPPLRRQSSANAALGASPPAGGPSSSAGSWRASVRERLDLRAGLRRDEERERRRLSRERDISRRRRRYGRYVGDVDLIAYPARHRGSPQAQRRDYLGGASSSSFYDPYGSLMRSRTPSPSGDHPPSGSSASGGGGGGSNSDTLRLPPLRELIWRRLRRRNAQLNLLEEEIGAAADRDTGGLSSSGNAVGDAVSRNRHREMLSWMVDQLTIDQQAAQAAQQQQQMGPAEGAESSAGAAASANAAITEHLSQLQRYQQLQQQHHDRMHLELQNRRHRIAQRIQESRDARAESIFLSHTSTSMLLTHRIQAWEIHSRKSQFPPDISDATANVVVKEAKIHNDASVDFSADGSILVTLVPSNLPMTTVVGVYGLSRATRGQCFATCCLESPAVSVSLSPTARHLLVGLTTRTTRMTLSPRDDRSLMAQVFRIKLPAAVAKKSNKDTSTSDSSLRGRLIHRQDIQQMETGQTALNCIRWLPVAGQGIVYATNTGLLKILR